MAIETQLPWVCPEHPEAQIRHSWDRTRTEVNWGPYRPRHTVSETESNHRYECAECGRELAPPTGDNDGD